ncbi:GIY-YIG nuclease family protein [Comamonas thiooxydans]|uniref:GIY-YIG nuclease family protein n=1 Tax=Comamonas thiooxydans TaxID=363952 RepID=UPI000B41EE6A|nr:GIY-YIG nuclease family protein [Comamonas thiooxydans]
MRFSNPFEIDANQAATKAVATVRQGKSLAFDEGPIGDEARDALVAGVPEWVAQRSGWLYLAQNEAWPGLYKLGCTRKGLDARMSRSSLNRTGLVTEWKAIALWKVYDAHGLESKAHARCKKNRHSFEMFRGPPELLVAQVNEALFADRALMCEKFRGILLKDSIDELFIATQEL